MEDLNFSSFAQQDQHQEQLLNLSKKNNLSQKQQINKFDKFKMEEQETALNLNLNSITTATSSFNNNNNNNFAVIENQTMKKQANQTANGINNNAKNKKLFPQKLWDLINDDNYNFCLRWSEDGQLVYLNRDVFEESYLKTNENQFHTQKAISFVRQMNMYGFRKVDDCYYENDNFKRDCEHLLKNMIRKHPAKNHHHNHHFQNSSIEQQNQQQQNSTKISTAINTNQSLIDDYCCVSNDDNDSRLICNTNSLNFNQAIPNENNMNNSNFIPSTTTLVNNCQSNGSLNVQITHLINILIYLIHSYYTNK